jgi:hypothetical protein
MAYIGVFFRKAWLAGRAGTDIAVSAATPKA